MIHSRFILNADHNDIIPLCSFKLKKICLPLFILIPSLIMGVVVCFWIYRCTGGAEADLCVHTAEGRDRSEAAL